MTEELGPGAVLNPNDEQQANGMRAMIRRHLEAVLEEDELILDDETLEERHQELIHEFMGYGPLQPLIDDPEITEIVAIGHEKIFVNRTGEREAVEVTLESEQHLRHIIDRLLAQYNQRLNANNLLHNVCLPNGTRLSVTSPPLSKEGTIVTIRKAVDRLPLTDQNLIDYGTASAEVMTFLRACVQAGMNIVVSGGRNAGKTALLNSLLTSIGEDAMTVIIENAPELQPPSALAIRLQTRPPNTSSGGPLPRSTNIGMLQLVNQALEMHPDWIIVGEVRDTTINRLFYAALLGHNWMTTVFSDDKDDTFNRLQVMCSTFTPGARRGIQTTMADSIDLIIHMERLGDGSRRIVNVAEVLGYENDQFQTADLFVFEKTGMDGDRIVGRHRATGIEPHFLSYIESRGIELPKDVFEAKKSRKK
jgi:pilus assembly protein CpaF